MVSTRVCGTLSTGSNPVSHPGKNRLLGGFLIKLEYEQ